MLLRVSGQLRCQNCLGRFAKAVAAECEISEMTSRRPLERRCQTKRDRCALIEAARDGCRRRLAVQLPDGSNKWDAGLSPFVRSSGQTATGTRQTTCGSTNDPDQRRRRPPTDAGARTLCGRIVWNGDESATGRTRARRSRPVFYCGCRQCCRQRGDISTDVAVADLSSSLSRCVVRS